MRVALDTNRYGDVARGLAEAVSVIESAEEVFIPFVVLGELRAGFATGRRSLENERVLRRFLLRPGVHSLFADIDTTQHYAAVYSQLRAQGTPIPTNDLWIAALILQHDLVLYARDQHFDHLPQITRI
jgi:tRNA(fMet)-specific endonuclease VapC